jgi:protein SCO1/2
MYAGENNKANGGFEHSGLCWLIKWHYKMRKDGLWIYIIMMVWKKSGVRNIQQDISILLKK